VLMTNGQQARSFYFPVQCLLLLSLSLNRPLKIKGLWGLISDLLVKQGKRRLSCNILAVVLSRLSIFLLPLQPFLFLYQEETLFSSVCFLGYINSLPTTIKIHRQYNNNKILGFHPCRPGDAASLLARPSLNQRGKRDERARERKKERRDRIKRDN
jgi:hypothetical protein